MWSCPFCGRTDKRTNEHVWPRWLQKYPAYAQLAASYKGERVKRPEHIMVPDQDGRYQPVETPTEHWATLLPHVQVPVCRPCNTGWMSRMEIAVQDLIDPMIRGEEVLLTPDDQALLAAWATKCMYAKTSTVLPSNNPWSKQEYEDFSRTQRPSRRTAIWMGRSLGPEDGPSTAYVGLQVEPIYMMPPDTPIDRIHDAPPGGATGYLAAHSVVFIGHWLNEEADYDDLAEAMYGNALGENLGEGLVRIWPPSSEVVWPTADIPEDRLVEQRTILNYAMDRAFGMPFTGRTDAEIAALVEEMESGVPPWEIRARLGVE